jgi:hypothetical protein
MILLTALNLENKDCHTRTVHSEEIIAIDAFSVIMVRKMMYDDNQQEGSQVTLAEGIELNVKELLTDIVRAVELEVPLP